MIKNEALVDIIKVHRNGRSYREIAKESGVSAPTLHRIERGQVPTLITFAKLCRWMKIDPSFILGLK